jgi:hypothetical protein
VVVNVSNIDSIAVSRQGDPFYSAPTAREEVAVDGLEPHEHRHAASDQGSALIPRPIRPSGAVPLVQRKSWQLATEASAW